MRYLFLLVFLFSSTTLHAAHSRNERSYQDEWCTKHNGQSEVVLPDKTRCDCMLTDHAIEFDFGPKFYEAIGQSLYYSLQTGKKSGIVLILEEQDDYKYWIRLNSIIEHFKLPIDTWNIIVY